MKLFIKAGMTVVLICSIYLIFTQKSPRIVKDEEKIIKSEIAAKLNANTVKLNDTAAKLNDTKNFQCLNSAKEQQEERQQIAKSQCKKFMLKEDLSVRWEKTIFNLGLIQPEAKFVSCIQSKAGSSFWHSVGLKLHGEDVFREPHQQYITFQDTFNLEEFDFSEYFFLLGVRHPFTRLVSAYIDKTTAFMEPKYEALLQTMFEPGRIPDENWKKIKISGYEKKQLVVVDLKKMPTYEEFVQHIVNDFDKCGTNISCIQVIDDHWRPYYAKCSFCVYHHDFIIKTETFDDDIKYFAKLLMEKLLKERHEICFKSRNYVSPFTDFHSEVLFKSEECNFQPNLLHNICQLDLDDMIQALKFEDKKPIKHLPINNKVENNADNSESVVENGKQETLQKRVYEINLTLERFESLIKERFKGLRVHMSGDDDTEKTAEKLYKVLSNTAKDKLRKIYHWDFILYDYDPYYYY